MMKDPLVSVGEAGAEILLRKKSFKPGLTSKIRPGNEREFILHKPIAVGHPIVERKISTQARTEGIPLGYQKTTLVKKIYELPNGKFALETETSVYEVVFKIS